MKKIKTLLANKMVQDGVLSIGAKVIFFLSLKFLIEPWMNVRMGDALFGRYVLVLGYISILAYSFGEALNHIRVLNQADDSRRAGQYRMIAAAEALCTFLVLFVYAAAVEHENVFHGAMLGLAGALMMLRLYCECVFRIEINYKKILLSSVLMAAGYLAGYLFFTMGAPWYVILIIGEAAAVIYAAIAGKAFYAQGRKRNLAASQQAPRAAGSPIAGGKLDGSFADTLKNTLTLTSSYLVSYVLIYMDRLLISFLLNDELVSIYYISTSYGKCVALVIPPITAVLLSNISKGLLPLDRKMVNRVAAGSLGAVLLFFTAGLFAARVMLSILYPASYEACQPIMDIGNLAQIVYYCCSIVNMLAIRMCPMKLQVKVEVSYAVLFIAAAYIGAKSFGLTGLAVGTLAANTARFLMLTVPVYRQLRKNEEQKI